MSILPKTNRRDFIKLAATAGGGLLLGFHWSDAAPASAAIISNVSTIPAVPAGTIDFNSYLSIAPDGVITILSPNPELGQNIKTSFPMIVAEELDADWTKVKVIQAALDTKKFERQVTGGS